MTIATASKTTSSPATSPRRSAIRGIFAFFSEMTPAREKSAYTTAYNQVVFLSIFIGPIIGKLLSNTGMPLVTIILVGALLRLSAGVLTQMHPRAWFARAQALASLTQSLIR